MRVDFENVGWWWVLVFAVAGIIFWWLAPTVKSINRAMPRPKAPEKDDEPRGEDRP